MFLSKKEIQDEYSKLYDELKSGMYSEADVSQMLFDSGKLSKDKVYEIILDMDRKIGSGLLKGRRKLLYWGLLPNERESIKKICDEANEFNVMEIFYKAFDEYFRIFLDNNLKYDEIKDEISDESINNEISRLYNCSVDFYFTKEYLLSIDKEVRRTRDIKAPNPSIATLLWSTIVIMDSHIKEWYFDKKVKHLSAYYSLTQEELDDLFVICTKANKLGIILYLGNSSENGIDHLTNDEVFRIAEVGKEVISKYFELLKNKNVEYKNKETKFLIKMEEFGKRHDIYEREIVDFANKALALGYNIVDIETQDELDEIYSKVFLEA